MTSHELEPHERRLLAHLVAHLPTVKAGDAKTYLGYRQVHERLGLSMQGPTYGRSLQTQGLENIARWALQIGAPAITGLVIDTGDGWPADGFFKVHSRKSTDFTFWIDQTTAAKTFDWSLFIADAPSVSNDVRPVAPAASSEEWAVQITWPLGTVELLDLYSVTACETLVTSEIASNSSLESAPLIYRVQARHSFDGDQSKYDIECVKRHQTDSRALHQGRFGRTRIVFNEVDGHAEWFDERGDTFNEHALKVEVVERPKMESPSDVIENKVSFTRFLGSLDCRLRIGWYWSAASDDRSRVIFTVWVDQIQDREYTLITDEDVYWKWLPGAYEMRRHIPLAIAEGAEVFGVLCYAVDESAATRKRKYYNEHELVRLRIENVGGNWIAHIGDLIDVEQLREGLIVPLSSDAHDDLEPPRGSIVPGRIPVTAGERILRDAMVRQYVLQRARGVCEFCLNNGFVMDDGRAYLECHHIQGLAAGGSDTIENVIALCPNDHRRAHFGRDRTEINARMLKLVLDQNRIRAAEKFNKKSPH